MRQQPTLAEILSDDTGKIRPEVADLLMEVPARRPRPQPARPPAGPPPLVTVLFMGAVVFLLAILGVNAMNGSNFKLIDPAKILATENSSSLPIQPAPAPAPASAPDPTRRGRVIGHKVSVRTQPSLHGTVIKEVDQDKVLNVLDFRAGWYEVELPEQCRGYVFGAYILPQDFDIHPYQAAVTNNGIKILIKKEERHPEFYRVILPNGQTTWIGKEYVEKYN